MTDLELVAVCFVTRGFVRYNKSRKSHSIGIAFRKNHNELSKKVANIIRKGNLNRGNCLIITRQVDIIEVGERLLPFIKLVDFSLERELYYLVERLKDRIEARNTPNFLREEVEESSSISEPQAPLPSFMSDIRE